MKKIAMFSLVAFMIFNLNLLSAQHKVDTIDLRTKGEMQTAEILRKVKVPKGTIVTLELNKSISSEDIEVGKIISVSAYLSVYVEGQEVILRGSAGEAIVKKVKKRRGYGRGGFIEIEAHNVMLYDNTRIRIKGEPFKNEGRSRKGLAWGLTCAVPIPPFVFFIGSTVKGMPAEIKAGEQIHGTIMYDIDVTSNPKSFINNE
jgi:hypothetical protein